MRLGQLSRKLGISTSEIINFLASKNISIGEDSNTKVDDEHAHWITEKYAPHLLEVVDAGISEERVEPTITTESPITNSEVSVQATEIVDAISQEPLATDEQALPEVIKAPKIELSGLKVLGKIELPEKNLPAGRQGKPTLQDSEETTMAEAELTPTAKPRTSLKREWTERPRKNPIALQREREERETEKKRKEKTLREKEKKTYAYLSKVKTQAPTKKSRVIEEQLEHAVATEEQPKTWWGKFKKWLRT